jgi:replicative DNA helicase
MLDGINKLPNDENAERHVIGLTLLDKVIPFQAKDLATVDFYNEFYKAGWSAILELDADGREIDPLTVFSNLKNRFPEYSDTKWMVSLTQTASGMISYNPQVFVNSIKNCATRRALMRDLSERVKELQDNPRVDEILQSINQKFEQKQQETSFRSLSDILEKDVKPALMDLTLGKTDKISTGFEALDHSLGGGIALSDILLIAGLPASGKSAFALKLSANIAEQKIPVAFLSGEMSDKENVFRLISQASDFMNLNSATYLAKSNHEYILSWVEFLKPLPIYFDSKTTDLTTMTKNLRGLMSQQKVKVLVIDYIQLLKTSRGAKQVRHERISEASQEVKRIAQEFGIAVIEVAQFNREGAKSNKTTMFDLEGSGQLEKDASIVLILDRDETDKGKVTFRIEKGRNTGLGVLEGRFTGMSLNFKDLTVTK